MPWQRSAAVVERLDAGWQHQGIVVDGGAAPVVFARGSIDGHRARVDLLAALWPWLRCIVGRVTGLPDRHDQPPLPWMLCDLSDQVIKEIVLGSCLRLLCRVARGLHRHHGPTTGREAPAASTKRNALRPLKLESAKPEVTWRFLIRASARAASG
jgi:hypothetical protein